MPSISRDICNWCFLQVVPPASAMLQHPDDEKEAGCWCKALICRQCAAVSLLEGEPSGLLLISIVVIFFIFIKIIFIITDSLQVGLRLQTLG